jgi:hypothetical protein
VGCTVGEEIVDDHSDDGEEEDNQRPEDLLARAAVGLDNLDCAALAHGSKLCNRMTGLKIVVKA